MINNLLEFLTYENIYLLANWGVLPFWLLLIILPNHFITKFFVQSIIAPLLLASAYCFIAYNIFLEGNIFDGFELYYGLDELYSMFSNEAFLLIFWLHFFGNKLICWLLGGKRLSKVFRAKIFCFHMFINNLFYGSSWIVILLVNKNIFFQKN